MELVLAEGQHRRILFAAVVLCKHQEVDDIFEQVAVLCRQQFEKIVLVVPYLTRICIIAFIEYLVRMRLFLFVRSLTDLRLPFKSLLLLLLEPSPCVRIPSGVGEVDPDEFNLRQDQPIEH